MLLILFPLLLPVVLLLIPKNVKKKKYTIPKASDFVVYYFMPISEEYNGLVLNNTRRDIFP